MDRAELAEVFGTTALVKSVPGADRVGFLRKIGAIGEDGIPAHGHLIGGAVAGVVGAFAWKNHPVLGFIGGESLGNNIPALFAAEQRRDALCNMAQTGAGMLGAHLLPSSATSRAIGFVVADILAGLLLSASGLRHKERGT